MLDVFGMARRREDMVLAHGLTTTAFCWVVSNESKISSVCRGFDNVAAQVMSAQFGEQKETVDIF